MAMGEPHWRDTFEKLFAEFGAPAIFLRNESRLEYTSYYPDFYKHYGSDPDIEIPEDASIHLRKWKYGETPFLLARKFTAFDSGYKAAQEKAAGSGDRIIQWHGDNHGLGNCILLSDLAPFTKAGLSEAILESRALLLSFRRIGMGDGEGSICIADDPGSEAVSLIFQRPCRLSKSNLPSASEFSYCEDFWDFYGYFSNYFLRKWD